MADYRHRMAKKPWDFGVREKMDELLEVDEYEQAAVRSKEIIAP
jgi:hypothetical protein